MKIHHLNCGTMCPLSARYINGSGSRLARGRMVCHCLLIESDAGLVLVDTGIGTHDVENHGLGALLNLAGKPRYDRSETAIERVRALGFDPKDVRHILTTHLDLDHAGGLADFPHATVHLHRAELTQASIDRSLNSRLRYLPHQWRHEVDWNPLEPGGERWFGFEAVQAIEGTADQILLVPLIGHSRGHSGVAVATADGWLLHCGDAYYHRNQVAPRRDAVVPVGIRLFQSTVVYDKRQREHNVERLRELATTHGHEVTLFCAHDPVSFEDLSGQVVT